MRPRSLCLRALASATLAYFIVLLASTAPAYATTTWWGLTSGSWPASLAPGGDGRIIVTAENLGYEPVQSATAPVVLKDVLPAELTVRETEVGGKEVPDIEGVAGEEKDFAYNRGPVECSLPSAHEVRCEFKPDLPEFTGKLSPFQEIEVRIGVAVGAQASSLEENHVQIAGGGGAEKSLSRPLDVGEASGFGIESFAMVAEDEGGMPSTQAGEHPFQLTNVVTLDTSEATENVRDQQPAGLPKDFTFQLPPGLVGNPTPFPRCSEAEFDTEEAGTEHNQCLASSAIGVATVTVNTQGSGGALNTMTVPLFNLPPQIGEPARFGFEVKGFAAFIDTSIRTGSDYGVTARVENVTEIPGFLSSKVTFWGVPGDPRHDGQRGWNCLEEERKGSCTPLGENNPPPFLSLPTTCSAPLRATAQADSWSEPHPAHLLQGPLFREYSMGTLDGCNHLQFEPSISVVPDVPHASSASGLRTDVHVPQRAALDPQGLAESAVRDIQVTLPEGVSLNPAGAGGLEACSEPQAGFSGFSEFEAGVQQARFTPELPTPLQPGINFCPNTAKIGIVSIRTPLLPNPIAGSVYVATQNQNPFGSLIALYLVAQDPISGTLVKLAGEVTLNQTTGQLTTTFANSPDLPFEDAELQFFGEERAPLSTPARCGVYTTAATFTPWSGTEPVPASSNFRITSGPNGGPCPGASLPFTPSLTGGTTDIDAAAFTQLTSTLGHEDGEQSIQSAHLQLPPGLSGILSGVALCPEPQANAGTCSTASQIGEITVSAGVGSEPVTVSGGRVYITGPYNGTGACNVETPGCAPFGLSIVDPVKTGPFDLEHDTSNPSQQPTCDCLVVRAKITVDPHTAALSVTTNAPGEGHAIPQIVDGVPVQLKRVNVTVNRPGFAFNPTSCDPMRISASIAGDEGAFSVQSIPFQVTNCALLGFAPKFAASTQGKTSRSNGASLTVKLTYPAAPLGSQANIRSVKVRLPEALPSRLKTLQKACPAAQFATDPAGCPTASIVGHARAITPLVPVPLEGPAYFVSNGGEAFPNLIVVLEGYGVTVDLVGDTFIGERGVTTSTFATVPDAPVGSFELTLPEGPTSALAANKDLCSLMKTVRVRSKVTVRVKGHTRRARREIAKREPAQLTMPTEFVAQNGAILHRTTVIRVTECRPPKPKRKQKRVSDHRFRSRRRSTHA